MPALLLVFFFVFGAIIGSFLNVLIHRLPLGENFVFPRSRCPHCQKLIVWYENIPLLSFLFLKGRCSSCKGEISKRYPLVELLTALAAVYLSYFASWTLPGMLVFIFQMLVFCILLVHFFIDWKHQILPDSLNLVLGAAFLAYALIHFSWQHWVIGAAVGAGFPLLVTWLFYLTRGQIGLGGGDIKLFGVLGIYLGPLAIIHTIFLSCFVGALYGGGAILLKKMDKSKPIAFGPFIILVALLQIFFPSFFAEYLIFV